MGEAAFIKRTILTGCPLNCWDGCSFAATVAEDGITRLAGNPNHPYSHRFICARGKRLREALYHPDRLLAPLRKTTTGFEEVSWDEAFDLMAERLEHARNKSTLSIAHYYDYGNGGALKELEHRFFNALGGVTVPEGDLCFENGLVAQRSDFGANRAHAPEDILNSQTIIIWGRNPYYTNVHLVPLLKKAQTQGAAVIVIDPIPTATARNADIHLQPKVGTDLALAMSLGNVIIGEGLLNEEFVTERTSGFEEYRQLCLKYPPNRTASLTGIAEKDIVELARRYAKMGPACILLGWGITRHSRAVSTIRAIDALGALTGNIGVPGGGVNFANRVNADSFADISGQELAKQRRLFPKADFGRALRSSQDPGVEVLFVTRSNPAVQLPGSSSFIKAMRETPFSVVIDFFMTPTAQNADLVLPAAMAFEDYDDVVTCSWHDYIIFLARVVEPRGQAKSEFDIYQELAQRLNLDGFSGTPKYWLRTLLAPLLEAGLDFGLLKEKGVARNPVALDVPWADGFATESERFIFLSNDAVKRECVEAQDQAFDLHLLTPTPKEYLHSQGNRVFREGLPTFHISPAKGMELGLDSGDRIRVKSPTGSLTGRVSLEEGLRDDVVVCYHGWWSEKEGSINYLTPTTYSRVGKGSALADCRCTIEKE